MRMSMPIMTFDMRAELIRLFPNLFNHYVSQEISSATPQYNCIAWAYGINTVRFWPNSELYGYKWPPSITDTETIDAFKELFNSIGYIECENGAFEDGYLKIAIYANDAGKPTHAARQLPNGYWTSKLGNYIDISHTIEGMSNGFYGNVVVYMKRAI